MDANINYSTYEALITLEKRKLTILKDKLGTKGGYKADKDKLRMDLIPYEALIAMASVLGYGAQKYEEHNWRKGIAHSRLYAATQRHLTAYWNGEDSDKESGLGHLAHALCDIAMMLASSKEDDRYKRKECPKPYSLT